uniref:Uncharacterized protein n=1 Tax=viral metagenome TaxID=1070528 RepID=A0A6C0BSK1_9ZZZZ
MASSNNAIIFPKELDVEKILYDEPRKLENGGKMIYVSFKKSPIRIQTPLCYCPFGINVYKNEDSNTETHTIELSFNGMNDKPNIMEFFTLMRNLDESNVSKGYEYQQNWFRKKYPSKEVIEALYTTMIKYPKDKNGEISTEWPPRLKCKLPYVDGKYKFEMYNKSNELIDPNEIQTKGSRMVVIMKCNGIWIAGGKFGMSWKAEQIQVIPPNKISGFSIRYIEEDMINNSVSSLSNDDDTQKKLTNMFSATKIQESEKSTETLVGKSNIVSDSDSDSDNEEDEPEAVPEAAVPEAVVPEAVPEAAVPEAAVPEAVPEAAVPEAVPETEPEAKKKVVVKKRIVKKKDT